MIDTAHLIDVLTPELAAPVHPGDPSDPNSHPFALNLAGLFGPFDAPEGMSKEDLEEAGIPSPELPRMFLEFLFYVIETKGGCSIVPTAELADLTTAARAREHKRHEKKALHCTCGVRLGNVMVQDFDTDNPRVTPELIRAFGAMNPDCGTGHKA